MHESATVTGFFEEKNDVPVFNSLFLKLVGKATPGLKSTPSVNKVFNKQKQIKYCLNRLCRSTSLF